jgi:hypothetical protein
MSATPQSCNDQSTACAGRSKKDGLSCFKLQKKCVNRWLILAKRREPCYHSHIVQVELLASPWEKRGGRNFREKIGGEARTAHENTDLSDGNEIRDGSRHSQCELAGYLSRYFLIGVTPAYCIA